MQDTVDSPDQGASMPEQVEETSPAEEQLAKETTGESADASQTEQKPAVK